VPRVLLPPELTPSLTPRSETRLRLWRRVCGATDSAPHDTGIPGPPHLSFLNPCTCRFILFGNRKRRLPHQERRAKKARPEGRASPSSGPAVGMWGRGAKPDGPRRGRGAQARWGRGGGAWARRRGWGVASGLARSTRCGWREPATCTDKSPRACGGAQPTVGGSPDPVQTAIPPPPPPPPPPPSRSRGRTAGSAGLFSVCAHACRYLPGEARCESGRACGLQSRLSMPDAAAPPPPPPLVLP